MGRTIENRVNADIVAISSSSSGLTVDVTEIVQTTDTGYEFTGGFHDRQVGSAGSSDLGTSVEYTADDVAAERWKRFSFSLSANDALDNPYWTIPTPADTSGVGLFGGSYMPSGVTSLIDFDFYDGADPSGYSIAQTSGDLIYSEASGSFDFTEASPGELALVRFDFNIIPQFANTTVEVALIWSTRDANDDVTFTFPLAAQPLFFGSGTVGNTYLNRPLITAYFASQEDVNARALLAVKSDQPVLIQPLTTLVTLIR